MASIELPPHLRKLERRMQNLLHRPNLRLVIDGADLFYVDDGIELRATDDGGWLLSEDLPDGRTAIAKLNADLEDEWSGSLEAKIRTGTDQRLGFGRRRRLAALVWAVRALPGGRFTPENARSDWSTVATTGLIGMAKQTFTACVRSLSGRKRDLATAPPVKARLSRQGGHPGYSAAITSP